MGGHLSDTDQAKKDDIMLEKNARKRWEALPKPTLIRLCNRYRTTGDEPLGPHVESDWTKAKLAEFLLV